MPRDNVEIQGTVAERIRLVRNLLAPAELAVVNALVGNYPMSGLVPIPQLAAAAQVSAPTVLRLIGKLGFQGYGAFQDAMRAEVQARLFSPVDVYPPRPAGTGETPIARAQATYIEAIHATFTHLPDAELASCVGALADEGRHVAVSGGRFSVALAHHLAAYLGMLRPGVRHVPPDSLSRIASLVDIGPGSIVVVFDYRRYQQDSIAWGLDAVDRGAHLILVTDQYLSPLAPHAHSLLTSSAIGAGPFDSMTCGFALVELLIGQVAQALGEPARARLAEFERWQKDAEAPGGREARLAVVNEAPPAPAPKRKTVAPATPAVRGGRKPRTS